MRVLVTGVFGRLGRGLIAAAAQDNIEVVGLDVIGRPANLSLPRGTQIHQGSYQDLALLRRIMPGCQAVIHTAGPHGEFVNTLPMPDFIDQNVTAVARMLELALELKVSNVVLSSTMEVLVGRDWTPSGAAVVDEDFAPATDSRYSLSRLLAETLGREFSRQTGLSVASLRYMAFGYGDDQNQGPGLLARSVATRDVARAALRATVVAPLFGDVIHIGPDTPLTNQDIIQAASEPYAVVERYWPGSKTILDQSGQILRWSHFWPVTRILKARRLLDWTPQTTFTTWLRDRGWRQPAA